MVTTGTCGEGGKEDQRLGAVVLKVLELAHFSQTKVEDIERRAFALFADGIDPHRLLLTEEDIEAASSLGGIRQDILSGKYAIRDRLVGRAIENAKSIRLPSETGGGGDDSDKRVPVVWSQLPRCQVSDELVDRWSLHQIRSRAKGELPLDPLQLAREISLRDKAETQEAFLNAVAGGFDQHTEYYGPYQRQLFTKEMELDSTSSGVKVERGSDGEVKVKEGEGAGVTEGKEVLGVIVEGATLDPRTLSDQRLSEVTEGGDGQDIHILLDGEEGVTKITPVSNPDNECRRARTTLLVHDGKKIGLITLPALYGAGRISSGNDFRQLLGRLIHSGAEAIVIDLRGNAGGGVYEASEAAGALMGDLVVALGVDRNGRRWEFKGSGRPLFTGPVVCLVDAETGSAAEILAGAIQDYQRGVIVGGGRTVGKWTTQAVIDLGEHGFGPGSGGAIKVSTMVITGPMGRVRQGIGVLPDIILPCGLEAVRIIRSLEGTAEQALKVPSTGARDKKVGRFSPKWHLKIREAKQESRDRVQKSDFFSLIDRLRQDVHECLSSNSLENHQCRAIKSLHSAITRGRRGEAIFQGYAVAGHDRGRLIDARLDPYEEEAVKVAGDLLGALPNEP